MLQRLDRYGQNGMKTPVRGSDIAMLLSDADLLTLLSSSDSPAIIEPPGKRKHITHRELNQFITHEFDLVKFGIGHGCRVAIVLPNSPELAVCILAVVSRWCAAPINSTYTSDEIKSELISMKCMAIIVLEGAPNSDAAIQAAEALQLGIIILNESNSKTGLFSLRLLATPPETARTVGPSHQKSVIGSTGSHPETVLLLHTSGTSGNKKCVPYSLDMILIGAGCIISSWNLKPEDMCLNMMPLFHIGGIVRNLFSPILAGGSMISCRGFDPAQFWDLLSLYKFTWYYAAPTMHHAILQEADRQLRYES